jgi:hypothetical protein
LGAASLRSGVAGLVAGLSAGALASFARDAINAVDAINDVADATGSTVENISALQDVARRTGTDVDTVTTALIKFNSQLQDADPTKGPGLVLKELGLEVKALRQLDPAEALRQVSVALAGYADDGSKARAVQELFGKSVKDTAAFLKDLSTQTQLVATVTTEQAAAAEKFNKELANLSANASDFARNVSIPIIRELNQIIERFQKAEKEGKGFFEKIFLSPSAMDAKNRAAGAFGKGLVQDVEEAQRELKLLETAAFQLSEKDPRLVAAREKLRAANAARNAAGGGRGFVVPPLASSLPSLDVQDQPKTGNNSRSTPTRATAPVVRADAELDAITAQFEQLYDLRDDRARQAAQLYQQLLTPIEELAQQEAKLQTLRSAGLISDETLARGRLAAADAYAEATDKAAGSTDKVVKGLDDISEAALKAGERLQEALGDQLFNVLDGNFSDIGDAFGDLLKRMAAEAAAAGITDLLLGSVGSGKTRSGGLLGDLGSSLLGSLLPSFEGGGSTGMGARAGGMDGRGGYLAMLHPQETVVDHTRGQSMGAVSVVINNTIGNVASMSDVVAGMQQTRAQILGEINRARTYGGAAA